MINLKGNALTLEQMRAILYQNEQIIIDNSAIENVVKSRKAVEQIVEKAELYMA